MCEMRMNEFIYGATVVERPKCVVCGRMWFDDDIYRHDGCYRKRCRIREDTSKEYSDKFENDLNNIFSRQGHRVHREKQRVVKNGSNPDFILDNRLVVEASIILPIETHARELSSLSYHSCSHTTDKLESKLKEKLSQHRKLVVDNGYSYVIAIKDYTCSMGGQSILELLYGEKYYAIHINKESGDVVGHSISSPRLESSEWQIEKYGIYGEDKYNYLSGVLYVDDSMKYRYVPNYNGVNMVDGDVFSWAKQLPDNMTLGDWNNF